MEAEDIKKAIENLNSIYISHRDYVDEMGCKDGTIFKIYKNDKRKRSDI